MSLLWARILVDQKKAGLNRDRTLNICGSSPQHLFLINSLLEDKQ